MFRLAQEKLGARAQLPHLLQADPQHSRGQVEAVVIAISREKRQIGARADRGREDPVACLDSEASDKFLAQLDLRNAQDVQPDAAQQVVEGRPVIVNAAKPAVDAGDLVRFDKNRYAVAYLKLEPMLAIDEAWHGLTVGGRVHGQIERRALHRAAQDFQGLWAHLSLLFPSCSQEGREPPRRPILINNGPGVDTVKWEGLATAGGALHHEG